MLHLQNYNTLLFLLRFESEMIQVSRLATIQNIRRPVVHFSVDNESCGHKLEFSSTFGLDKGIYCKLSIVARLGNVKCFASAWRANIISISLPHRLVMLGPEERVKIIYEWYDVILFLFASYFSSSSCRSLMIFFKSLPIVHLCNTFSMKEV